MKVNKLTCYLALFCTAAIWGVNYVAQSVGGEVGTFTFNTVCSVLSFASLLLIAIVQKASFDKHSVVSGLLCGVILLLAMTTQQFGVVNSTVGKSGFITALYIVIVPFLGLINGQRITKMMVAGVVLATAGLFLLCITEGFVFQIGDVLLLLCAFFFALQIVVIDKHCKTADPVVMSCFQFVVVGVVSAVCMFIFEDPQIADIHANIWPLLFAGIVGNGVAYTLQMIGQLKVNPSVCSLILSLESPISVIAGILFLSQVPSLRELAGCALMFTAIYIAQKN